jgi:non-ribosomal peptide synthetase component F
MARNAPPPCSPLAPFAADCAQALDLRRAVRARVVLEVRGDDAQRTEGSLDDRLDRAARHGRHVGGRPRQRVAQHATDLKARQDQVAEAAAPAVLRRQIDAAHQAAFVLR